MQLIRERHVGEPMHWNVTYEPLLGDQTPVFGSITPSFGTADCGKHWMYLSIYGIKS